MTGTVHINSRIRQNAETLAAALEGHMHKIFAPDARKELRLFSAGEAAELLGILTIRPPKSTPPPVAVDTILPTICLSCDAFLKPMPRPAAPTSAVAVKATSCRFCRS